MADFTFLKGNIETIILCSLYNRDKYGYEIAKDIKDRTENAYEIKQPTLYSYLKRLQDDDLIDSYWGTESNGGRRRYYKLTDLGRKNCEKFVSEWEFQRNVLSNLVDGTTEASEVTQEEVTPLFGRRSQRRRKIDQDSFDQQDELEAMLNQLEGNTEADENDEFTEEQLDEVAEEAEEPTEDYTEEQTEVAEEVDQPQEEPQPAPQPQQEQPQAQPQQQPPVVVNVVFQNVAPQPVQNEQPVQPEPQQQPVFEQAPYNQQTDYFYRHDESQVAATVAPQQETAPAQQPFDRKGIFDVKQDDADDFIQGFDALVKDASERQNAYSSDTMSASGAPVENYQHVLMGVLGSQLDDAEQYGNGEEYSAADFADRPVQLEQIADSFAQEGIRLRIYNHATANFKSKALMPLTKIVSQTGWLTYLFAALYFGILTAISAPTGSWQAFVITLSVLIVAPVVMSIVAFVEPGRKEKPNFAFRPLFIVACVVALIIALLSASISFFNGIEFGIFDQVAVKILLPTGIALLFPVYVFIYNIFYKKY